MKIKVINLENEEEGEVELSEEIFSCEVRKDIMSRAVEYQLTKRRKGSVKTKSRGEINRTGKKLHAQKKTGKARHGAASAGLFRGGGHIFALRPKSWKNSLPKAIRHKALCSALSLKLGEGKLVVIDAFTMGSIKTKELDSNLAKIGMSSALFVDGVETDNNFKLSLRNLPCRDIISYNGANVYDILNHEWLVLSRMGLEKITERLSMDKAKDNVVKDKEVKDNEGREGVI